MFESDKGITHLIRTQKRRFFPTDGDEVIEGYVVTFIGNVSDANHSADQLTATWKSGSPLRAAIANLDGIVCEAIFTPDDTDHA